LDGEGRKLSQVRRRAAPRLAKDIVEHLGALGFKQSVFEVVLQDEEEPGARGMERVDFLFGPNPGEPSKPLRIIASSGEMSRVMLAVKSALAEQDPIPLMVFDEIDANVGGEIAHAVGAKMAALGREHQVVSITHLPQVAAAAHCHYVVNKEVSGKRTRSLLREVTGDLRVSELARMLGGTGDSERALAEAMLTGAASR
jgi:DNA repair protein RecN (Recombination protein N)